jgi:predicted transposase/invertase (TIGR01784 family)
MRFANPKNDVAFKKIFGDRNKPETLISFLNAVMGLSGETAIIRVEIMNPLQAPYIEGLKMTTLDVRAEDASGKTFIVEMQANAEDSFAKRSLFYTSQAYIAQLERGRSYKDLQPVYFIGILDFNLFEGTDYLSRHLLLNSRTFKHDLTDFELYFIELKKFTKTIDELDSMLEKWIYFVQHAQDFEDPPTQLQSEPQIAVALEAIARYKWTRLEMEAYQYWEFERLKLVTVEEKYLDLKAENAVQQSKLEKQEREIAQRDSEIAQRDSEIAQRDSEIAQKDIALSNAARVLASSGMAAANIAQTLNLSEEQVMMMLLRE